MDFVGARELDRFVRRVASERPDIVLITGDLAVATTLRVILEIFGRRIGCPIYFVLGNQQSLSLRRDLSG